MQVVLALILWFAVSPVLSPVVSAAGAQAGNPSIVLQSTTSTQNAGLFEALLPQIERATGVSVKVVAVGTGQAINNAERCNGDLLWVHAEAAERAFVDAGYGVARFPVMYNDFVLVGPASDVAEVAGGRDILVALGQIHHRGALFASRGDDSGTHKAERALWLDAGLEPARRWYRETGSGMGATLNLAIGMGAYTLTDRATWIAFGNKRDHQILVEGDDRLFNQYGIIRVAETHCPDVASGPAQAVIDWVLSEPGQAAINAYQVDGQQLFFANAR